VRCCTASTPGSPRDRHADPHRRQPARCRGASARASRLEEFEALKGVLFACSAPFAALVIDVLGPVGRGFKSATKPVRSWWGGVNDYDRIAAENDKLRDEVERLKAKQARQLVGRCRACPS
jgi:hypothetical protein